MELCTSQSRNAIQFFVKLYEKWFCFDKKSSILIFAINTGQISRKAPSLCLCRGYWDAAPSQHYRPGLVAETLT
jgi:hypothetical protein